MTRKPQKVIVTCAITGSDTFPSQTPYLPITPDEIAESAFEAYKAGAAIVHIHVRDPETGIPTSDLDIWGETLSKIKQKCDVVIAPTTGGGGTPDERIATVKKYQPEMCSYNLESINYGVFPLLKYEEIQWKDWERKKILESKDDVYVNTFEMIEHFGKVMKRSNTKPECELFSLNGLYTLRFMTRQGWINPPLHMQFVLGVLGGTGCYPQEMLHMQTEAIRIFGEENFTWSAAGVGFPGQFKIAALSMMHGGHIRVGMEDNIRIRSDKLAKSNAELVKQAIYFADVFYREPATPADARKILGLKGNDKVNF